MAVVASYTWEQTGTYTVKFTDTSTGSPNRWLWEFGDGEVSVAQNPTHVYASQGSFSVTMTSFIQTGTTNISDTVVESREKTGGPSASPTGAHNAFLANPWSTWAARGFQVRYKLSFIGGGYVVLGGESKLSWNLSGYSGVAELQLDIFPVNNPAGSSIISANGDYLDTGSVSGWTPFKNVTDKLGTTFQETLTDGSGYTYDGLEFFCRGSRVVVWTATDIDTDSQTVTLTPFAVDFVADIVYGQNPMTVNFTDLSDSGASNWSWKKRKAGTSDVFVEFSTDQNPTHIFDKDSP